jgi:hypothetical protein
MTTATITGLDLADDGVVLVRANCDHCQKTVLHGAGRDLNAPVLGHRSAHCGCTDHEGYELLDPHGVVSLRLRVIREELAETAARRAAARARRATA